MWAQHARHPVAAPDHVVPHPADFEIASGPRAVASVDAGVVPLDVYVLDGDLGMAGCGDAAQSGAPLGWATSPAGRLTASLRRLSEGAPEAKAEALTPHSRNSTPRHVGAGELPRLPM